jgi:hypothetical protein
VLPVGLGILQYGIYRLLGGGHDFTGTFPWHLYAACFIPTALLTGGNDELSWRGFGLPAFLR